MTTFVRASEIINHRIIRVWSLDLPMVEDYQPRRIYLELESKLVFNFTQKMTTSPAGYALMTASDLPSGSQVVLDLSTNPRLDSPVKSIIDSEDWEASFGVLLENGLVLFQGCNEWEEFLVFST